MDIEAILEENKQLKVLVEELREKLSKYTNPNRNKKYYENNKDKFIETSNQRLEKLKEENPEKLKEYRRNAYLKRKEKLKNSNIKENTLCA
jgi:hypothetical protein